MRFEGGIGSKPSGSYGSSKGWFLSVSVRGFLALRRTYVDAAEAKTEAEAAACVYWMTSNTAHLSSG